MMYLHALLVVVTVCGIIEKSELIMEQAQKQLDALLNTIELLNAANPPSDEACSHENNERDVAKFAKAAAQAILIVADVDGLSGCKLCQS